MKPYLWFLAAISGCQDYLFAPLCPQSIEESTITAVPIAARPADILFIVDNSGSMADDQRRIAASFDVFINELSQVAIADYQIAVVTTDLSTDGGEKKGEVMLDWGDAPPFEVERSSGSCTDTGIAHGCFRGPIITSKMSALEQDQIFTENVTVGSCGSGNEQGLAAAIRALENAGGCNAGFIREDSNLVLIFVTDEQDASPDSVDQYVAALSSRAFALGKDWSDIRAAAIIGSVGGSASNCNVIGGLPNDACGSQCSECPGASWCGDVDPVLFAGSGCAFCSHYNAPDCCSAVSGSRYERFLAEVDARAKAADDAIDTATLIDSICQDDFSATLKRIANEILIDPCYDLTATAVNPEGVSAQVAGGRTLEKSVDFEVKQKVDGTYEVCIQPGVLGPGDQLQISFVTSLESRPSLNPACN